MEDFIKNYFVLVGSSRMELRNNNLEGGRVKEVILYKAVEGLVVAPHGLKSKRFISRSPSIIKDRE